MTQYIRFKINMPKCPHCKNYIENEIRRKNRIIDSINVSYYNSWGTDVEFRYDNTKNNLIDKYKLEQELKNQIKDLGYKVL